MPKKINGPVDPVVNDSSEARRRPCATPSTRAPASRTPPTSASKALDYRSDLGGLNLSTVPKIFIECGNMRNADEAAKFQDPRSGSGSRWPWPTACSTISTRVIPRRLDMIWHDDSSSSGSPDGLSARPGCRRLRARRRWSTPYGSRSPCSTCGPATPGAVAMEARPGARRGGVPADVTAARRARSRPGTGRAPSTPGQTLRQLLPRRAPFRVPRRGAVDRPLRPGRGRAPLLLARRCTSTWPGTSCPSGRCCGWST